jgi:hypothetical protein
MPTGKKGRGKKTRSRLEYRIQGAASAKSPESLERLCSIILPMQTQKSQVLHPTQFRTQMDYSTLRSIMRRSIFMQCIQIYDLAISSSRPINLLTQSLLCQIYHHGRRPFPDFDIRPSFHFSNFLIFVRI